MKRAYYALLIASAFSVPTLSHAETTTAPITRAQVRAQLIAAEQAGQYPRAYANYPDPALDAASKRAAIQAAADSSYGSESTGHSASGFVEVRARVAANTESQIGEAQFEDVYRGRK
jgi:hypothetical protein